MPAYVLIIRTCPFPSDALLCMLEAGLYVHMHIDIGLGDSAKALRLGDNSLSDDAKEKRAGGFSY